MEEMQSVSSEVRENVTADVWKIAGSLESFFGGQLDGGSYPWEDDVQGCMVSTALAEKLFGTKNVQGNRITIEGMEYYIRGCVKKRKRICGCPGRRGGGAERDFSGIRGEIGAGIFRTECFDADDGKEAKGFF